MDWKLSLCEARVLGCLLEKEMTTPDYYPLTLNSLVSACNQKSNRDPVMSLEEDTVFKTIEGLRERHLAVRVDVAGSRVAKFRHAFTRHFPVEPRELAILMVLLLRGPQTLGEIRTRCERSYAFQDIEETEAAISGLADLTPEPLVALLARRPGQKERRYTHLLSGPADEGGAETATGELESEDLALPEENTLGLAAQLACLKEEVAAQRASLDQLREDFESLRKQFE